MIDLEATYGIWLRDVVCYFRERSRLLGGIVRPALWLVIMGTGLRPAFKGAAGFDYIHYIFPGVLAMTLVFASVQSAISIVWDREFGFLKGVLVAPIPRPSVVIGKALSGATTSTLQGIITLLFASLVGIWLSPLALVKVLVLMFIISFALVSLGIVIACRLSSFEGFGTIANFVIMPMFFLSGALFPTEGLPAWLKILIIVNPLTYGVDAMRGVTIGLHEFSLAFDVGFMLVFGALMLGLAVPLFSRE